MITNFKINFIEDYRNCDNITFVDVTDYNLDVPIKTPVVSIIVPNFTTLLESSYVPMSTNTVSVGKYGDGLYKFKLSICPNDKLYKEFSYYNICTAISRIKGNICSDSSIENIEKQMEFYNQLLAAKILGESCNKSNEKKADIIYQNIMNSL